MIAFQRECRQQVVGTQLDGLQVVGAGKFERLVQDAGSLLQSLDVRQVRAAMQKCLCEERPRLRHFEGRERLVEQRRRLVKIPHQVQHASQLSQCASTDERVGAIADRAKAIEQDPRLLQASSEREHIAQRQGGRTTGRVAVALVEPDRRAKPLLRHAGRRCGTAPGPPARAMRPLDVVLGQLGGLLEVAVGL